MARLDFTMLPRECVSKIISLTTPRDACRLLLLASTVRSVADSDEVWEKFLPSDYQDIILRSTTPLKFSSKKELFFCLSNSILIDGGTKRFSLEQSSGKKCYMLSARELSIAYGNDRMSWSWKPMPESRFREVAELVTVWWLQIQGKIKTQMLSPNTTYSAYLIAKIVKRAFGLDAVPSETSIEVGTHTVYTNSVYLCHSNSNKHQRSCLVCGNGKERVKLIHEREDGWLEIEIGKFFSCEVNEEVKISLTEVKGYQLKGGIIIEGIELRPSL